MKKYKELLESLSHDYVLHSLADKDINAHVKDGKIVVHPDDAASTRAHLRKIGHGHLKVTTKGAHQVAEEVEQIDENSAPFKDLHSAIKRSEEHTSELQSTDVSRMPSSA